MPLTPNFEFTLDGLEVRFTDTSEIDGSPIASRLWDFGDSTASSAENPVHTYAAAGVYIVKLTVTAVDTSSAFITQMILVSTGVNIPVPIRTQIACKIPNYEDELCITTAIQKWQLLLQCSPDPEIADEDVFDESAWPARYNAFIADLATYELLIGLFNSYAIASAASGVSSTTSSSSSSSSSEDSSSGDDEETLGAIKSIETGPAKTEFYDPQSNSASEATADLVSTYFKESDGLLAEYKALLCTWASSLGVHLKICGNCKSATVKPILMGRPNPDHNVWKHIQHLSPKC